MRSKRGRYWIAVWAVCFLFLHGCGAFVLPPLPTPAKETPAAEPPASQAPAPAVLEQTPAETAAAEPTPELTPEPAPTVSPTPVPEPTPTPENPDQPHLRIQEETRPERVKRYDVFSLQGIVETDKGVIIELRGAILDAEGIIVQKSALYQPHDDQVSLAGTVNADLRFAELSVGDYVYQVVAVAENNGLRDREVLIDQPFSIVPD